MRKNIFTDKEAGDWLAWDDYRSHGLDLHLASWLPIWAPFPGALARVHTCFSLPFPRTIQSHLGLILSILPPCSDHHQYIGHDETVHSSHNHRIVLKGGKELSGMADINSIRHHQECASKEGKMVAEVVCLEGSGSWPHLQPQRGPGGNASTSLNGSSPRESDEKWTLSWRRGWGACWETSSGFCLGF